MRHGLTMAPAGLFLVLVLAGAGPDPVPAGATVLDERFGCRTAPILLLLRPDVQVELKLDPQQVAAAKTAIARLLDRALSLKGKKGDAVKEERGRIDREMVNWLRTTLSEPQCDRLLEIDLQWEGAAAMTRDHVVGHLKLSERQRLSIDRLLKQLETTRQTRGMLSPSEIGQVAGRAQALLSPEQKEIWANSLGKPCQFWIRGQSVITQIPSDPGVVKTRVRSER